MITQAQYDDLLAMCLSQESEDNVTDDLAQYIGDLIAKIDESTLTFEQAGAFHSIVEFDNARDLYPGIHWDFKKLIA